MKLRAQAMIAALAAALATPAMAGKPVPIPVPPPIIVTSVDVPPPESYGDIAYLGSRAWIDEGAIKAAEAYARGASRFRFKGAALAEQSKIMADWITALSYADTGAAQKRLDEWNSRDPIAQGARPREMAQRATLQARIWLREGKGREARSLIEGISRAASTEVATIQSDHQKWLKDKTNRHRYYVPLERATALQGAVDELRYASFLIDAHERGEAAFASYGSPGQNPFFRTSSQLFLHSGARINCASAGVEPKDWMIAEVGMDRIKRRMIITPYAQSRDAIIAPALEAMDNWTFSIEGMRSIAEREHILVRCTRAAPLSEDIRPDYDYLVAHYKDRTVPFDKDYDFNSFHDPYEQLVKDNQWPRLINAAYKANPVVPHRHRLALNALRAALQAEPKPNAAAIAIVDYWGMPVPAPGENYRYGTAILRNTEFLAQVRAIPDFPPRVLAQMELKLAEYHEIAKDVPSAVALYKGIVSRAPATLKEKSSEVVRAQLRLAALAESSGARKDAEAIIATLGLSPEQCSIYQARPAITSFRQPDYPSYALREEREGSVQFEFDLSKEGKPTNFRILASTPPFVFDARTISSFSAASFAPATRGGEALPCEAAVQGFVWRIPD